MITREYLCSLGTQAQTGNDFLLTYHTKDNTWAVANIDIPFTVAFNKLEYYAGNLYLTDQNESGLYTVQADVINLNPYLIFMCREMVIYWR